MRLFINLIFGLPILFATVSFAVHNREVVKISLWPLPFEAEIPIAILLISIFGASFALGCLYSWLAGLKNVRALFGERKKNRHLEKDFSRQTDTIKSLENKVAELEKTLLEKEKQVQEKENQKPVAASKKSWRLFG